MSGSITNAARDLFLVSPKGARITLTLKIKSFPLWHHALPQKPDLLRTIGKEVRVLLACTMVLSPEHPETTDWLRLLAPTRCRLSA